jgi:NADH:ubiquinone oxidoreductase subunit 3 (subunit A)
MEDYIGIFIALAIIVLIILIEWKIGKFIGNRLSPTIGLVVGIILIVCGVTLFVAIPCIVYSQKNKQKSLEVNINKNTETENS